MNGTTSPSEFVIFRPMRCPLTKSGSMHRRAKRPACHYLAVLALLASCLLAPSPLQAASTYNWNSNNTSTNWNTGSNWSGSIVPGNSDVAKFSSSAYSAQPSLALSSSVGGVWSTGAGAVTIGGSAADLDRH